MSQIEIRCVDQTAMFTNLPEIFSGDVNIDTVKFTFDDSWNGYTTKTAVFYNNPKDVYPQILDVNDIAVIPSQVMTKQCKLSIGVFGTKANGDVKTSKILTYNVGKGAINSDLESTPATPDFWTQLLSRQINFENTINTKVDTLETNVETVEAIAKGRNQALAYNSYSEMITALNGMTKDELKRGQNIYIGTVGVPDLWVYGVETTKSTYTYTNDTTFVNGLNNNVTVKVGYYKLAQLETQKVDVGGINADINGLKSDVEGLQTDLENLNLSATSVSVDDTNLALGGTNVQDTLEALKNAIKDLQTSIDSKVGEWKYHGFVNGANEMTLPSDYKELLVTCEPNSSSNGWIPTNSSFPILLGTIPRNTLSSTKKYIALTNFSTDGNYVQCCEVYVNLSSLMLTNASFNGSVGMQDYYKTTVYYR